MSKFTVNITGETMAEVQAAILELAAQVGGERVTAVRLDEPEAIAEVDVSLNAPSDKPAPNMVTDKSPEDAIKEGTKTVQNHFADHPEAMPLINDLQAKYGVKKFASIGLDQAHAFLADAQLLASGAPAAAA